MYKEACRSDSDISKQRPVLREILDAWAIQYGTTIVCGTGLSGKEVEEVRDELDSDSSGVAKSDILRWITYTETGAFDSPQAQSSYISRYLPPHLIQSDSGRLLLRRCWLWLRGRHCFTASYLEILISNSFFSPHKVLDEYILHLTSQAPYDSPNFAGSEYQLSKELIANIRSLPFVNLKTITEDPAIAHHLGEIVCSWVIRHKYVVSNDDEKRWVELGFARFCHSPDTLKEQTMIDEPLIIHATTHHLAKHTSMGLFDHVLNHLAHDAGIGPKFKDLLAVYLAHAFGPGVCLSDIFDFGENVPSWALSEGVELLALSSDGDHHTVSHPMGPSSSLSCDPMNPEETVDWFRKSYTPMCFPDNLLGPDLVFSIRLPDGRVLCVIVQ